MAVGKRNGTVLTLDAPEPVGALATLLARLEHRAAGGGVVVGFDFPIGLPIAYAQRRGIAHFPTFLRQLQANDVFFAVCDSSSDIRLERPFYPRRPGGTLHQHLLEGLGVPTMATLLRVAERPQANRPGACALFWTLGGNQVGRGAIEGWRDVIAPALRRPTPARLWPFDGEVRALASAGATVLCETYPADALRQLGLTLPGSKRDRDVRLGTRPALVAHLQRLNAVPTSALMTAIDDGFGKVRGDDRFDAFVGLLAMIDVVEGRRAAGPPTSLSPALRAVEGWILGQGEPAAVETSPLVRLAELVRTRNAIEAEMGALLGRPPNTGALGETIAAAAFHIELEPSGSARTIDGRFTRGPLAGRTVNIKLYRRRENLLDIAITDQPQHYLVLTGPPTTKAQPHHPLIITDAFCFSSSDLLKRVKRPGTAASVPAELWESARVWPTCSGENPFAEIDTALLARFR